MTRTKKNEKGGGGQQLVITRVINAPRNVVFKAWIDPKQAAEWWGPKGFTNPLCQLDVKPSGSIRIEMRAPNGRGYPMDGEYREIKAPEKLVFISAALDENGRRLFEALNTITFEDQNRKTRLTLRADVLNAAAGAAPYLAGMPAGWNQSLDRFENYIQDTSDREIISSRVIHAPRERVFRAFSDPKHLVHWWGPKDFTNTFHEFDFRPGGEWIFIMHGPNGANFVNKSVFSEVVKPERIVYDHVTGPQFQMTMTFADEKGKTKLTWRMLFPTAAECAKVKSFVPDKNEENYDRLEAELKKMQ